MTRYRVVWPMISGVRTGSSGIGGGNKHACHAVLAYAGQTLSAGVLPEEIERLLADGAIEAIDLDGVAQVTPTAV